MQITKNDFSKHLKKKSIIKKKYEILKPSIYTKKKEIKETYLYKVALHTWKKTKTKRFN